MIRMVSWPEHVTGQRARTGKVQRDHATCAWDGRDFRVLKFSATTALARMLVAAGCPDQPWQSYTPAGRRSLFGPSLHRWAKRVVAEGPDSPIRVQDYQEFPGLPAQGVNKDGSED